MRTGIRKILPLLLAGAMSISLFGCGGGASESDNSGSSDRGTENTESSESGSDEKELARLQAAVNESLEELNDEDFTIAQLAGTDALGRRTEPTSGLRKDKYVGLFYFVAHGTTAEGLTEDQIKIYDITKILASEGVTVGDKSKKLTNSVMALASGQTADYYDPDVSPENLPHWWGEPLYGYYRSDDPWVIRKHLELFENAGIDFLYLDYTNAIVYPEETCALLDAVVEMQEAGFHPPEIVFLMSYRQDFCSWEWGQVYKYYYSEEKYDNCWFRGNENLNPEGKPLIVGHECLTETNEADEFWFKPIQWPGQIYQENAFPWMDWNIIQKNHNGVMVVTVSQGGTDSSEAYFDPSESYRARGWTAENPLEQGTDYDNVMSGTNFQFSWDNALSVKEELDIINITGWNEWVVRKLTPTDGASKGFDYAEYVDCFSMEHSRDAEMMKGGYGDNYYMQIAQNVRAFKGTMVEGIANIYRGAARTVDLNSLADWEKVTRKYLDFGADLISREWTAADRSIPYIDRTNRNDIDYIKICNDGTNLYVAVTAKEAITAYESGDTGWMNLYISTGAGSGWENYNYVINRAPLLTEGKTSIEKYTGTGSEALPSGEGRIAVYGNTVVYEIPLSSLGVKSGDAIEIKATDNLQIFGNIDEFYISGDSAPMGRLNYAYKLA